MRLLCSELAAARASASSGPCEEFDVFFVLSSIGTRWTSSGNWTSLGCELEHESCTVQHFSESPHRHFRLHGCGSFVPCCSVARDGFTAAPLRHLRLSCVVPTAQVVSFLPLCQHRRNELWRHWKRKDLYKIVHDLMKALSPLRTMSNTRTAWQPRSAVLKTS